LLAAMEAALGGTSVHRALFFNIRVYLIEKRDRDVSKDDLAVWG